MSSRYGVLLVPDGERFGVLREKDYLWILCWNCLNKLNLPGSSCGGCNMTFTTPKVFDESGDLLGRAGAAVQVGVEGDDWEQRHEAITRWLKAWLEVDVDVTLIFD